MLHSLTPLLEVGSTEVCRSCCTCMRQSTNPRLEAQQEYFALGSRTAVRDPNPATTASSSRGLDEQSQHHRALTTQNLTEEFKVWETHLSRSHQHVNTKRRQPVLGKAAVEGSCAAAGRFPGAAGMHHVHHALYRPEPKSSQPGEAYTPLATTSTTTKDSTQF